MAAARRSSRRLLANAIRALSMDAVQQANSGHPGMPMGMADIAEVLWNDYLRHNPANPHWVDRDRFVLSNGHGSMLLYSLLHLTGYDLPLAELRNFRQLGSKTPGHPEYGLTPGVETTTGPLGQGLAMAVGMALAERLLAARFNRDGFTVVDHHTYVFAGDGCLMEGVSHEACSLAGTLGLGKLVVFYDDNGISIDGEVKGWFRDDTPKRFQGYNWHVVPDVDGHDADAVQSALAQARAETSRPTLICCKTVIGWGSPSKAGTAEAHGSVLGKEEVVATRKQLNWEHAAFEVPQAIYQDWDARERGEGLETQWRQLFERYREQYPELATEFERRIRRALPAGWDGAISGYLVHAQAGANNSATRKSSQAVLNEIAEYLPELVGGSADLTGSNSTRWDQAKSVVPAELDGNYIYFGVREFGMTAALNGMTLHGGLRPFGGTFLTFSDYARNAVRLAALMGIPTTLVYTHDSIGLGEDGPTHQPVEHLASLRLIPNLDLWRPCDAVETGAAWRAAIERRDGPVAIALSRQNLVHQTRDEDQLQAIGRGGYVLHEPPGAAQGLIMATGSEVELAVEAAQRLAHEGHLVRVVSMPCVDLFERQDDSYRDEVLPPTMPLRLALEAGVTTGWWHLVGSRGAVLGLQGYGESAPAADVFKHFGLSADQVAESMRRVLEPVDT